MGVIQLNRCPFILRDEKLILSVRRITRDRAPFVIDKLLNGSVEILAGLQSNGIPNSLWHELFGFLVASGELKQAKNESRLNFRSVIVDACFETEIARIHHILQAIETEATFKIVGEFIGLVTDPDRGFQRCAPCAKTMVVF